MLSELKKIVCDANLELVDLGLVIFTWGNVSGIDRDKNLFVIKPSGLSYDKMTFNDMVVCDMEGNVVEGDYNPSSDTPTHIEIYKNINTDSVVHTHSKWATIWSQAGKMLPCFGTTHADNFYGAIPVTREMSNEEIKSEYEKNTGKVIIEAFRDCGINPLDVPGVLVKNHGPFTWGKTPKKAVENSAVLEYVAHMAYISMDLNPKIEMKQELIDKHYLRKHGSGAYYGQKEL